MPIVGSIGGTSIRAGLPWAHTYAERVGAVGRRLGGPRR